MCKFLEKLYVPKFWKNEKSNSALEKDTYEILLALGVKKSYLGDFRSQTHASEASHAWKFLILPYGNPTFETHSAVFFEPEMVVYLLKNETELVWVNNGIQENEFFERKKEFLSFQGSASVVHQKTNFTSDVSRLQYLETVSNIREDIRNGAYYEMNYCIRFHSNMDL